MIRYHQDANYRSVAVTNIRTKPAFVGGVGFEPTVFLMYWVYSPAPNRHLSSPPVIFVWMARLERALAITACSGPQNRRGLPTPPHPDYKFFQTCQ